MRYRETQQRYRLIAVSFPQLVCSPRCPGEQRGDALRLDQLGVTRNCLGFFVRGCGEEGSARCVVSGVQAPHARREPGREGHDESFCFSALKTAGWWLLSQEWWVLPLLAGKKKKKGRMGETVSEQVAWDPVILLAPFVPPRSALGASDASSSRVWLVLFHGRLWFNGTRGMWLPSVGFLGAGDTFGLRCPSGVTHRRHRWLCTKAGAGGGPLLYGTKSGSSEAPGQADALCFSLISIPVVVEVAHGFCILYNSVFISRGWHSFCLEIRRAVSLNSSI